MVWRLCRSKLYDLSVSHRQTYSVDSQVQSNSKKNTQEQSKTHTKVNFQTTQ